MSAPFVMALLRDLHTRPGLRAAWDALDEETRLDLYDR